MREQTTRQLMITALIFSGVFSLINLWLTDSDWLTTAISAPIFFVVMFFSMRASNRISRAIANRLRPPPPEPPAPPEPTTERPEHAQRRRSRRRRRGRGRRL